MREELADEQLLSKVIGQVPTAAHVREKVAQETRKIVWRIPGFSGKSRVLTTFGHLPIEALRRRDPLKTQCGRYLEVQAVDKLRLDEQFLALHPEAQPIYFPKGSLGLQQPNQDMLVSPAQKVRLPGRHDKPSGQKASSLSGLANISRKSQGFLTYYVFHCGTDCTINVDGLWFDLSAG